MPQTPESEAKGCNSPLPASLRPLLHERGHLPVPGERGGPNDGRELGADPAEGAHIRALRLWLGIAGPRLH